MVHTGPCSPRFGAETLAFPQALHSNGRALISGEKTGLEIKQGT